MPAVGRSAAQRIFEVLFSLFDAQEDFQYAPLEARLEEADRALLSAVLFADEIDGGETASLAQVQACLRELESEDREFQRAAVRTRIKEAERRGEVVEALRLAEELNRMDRG